MKLVEIFRSIEGEGALMGAPTIFVRLFGCNLRCVWCDSAYAYEPLGVYSEATIDEIAARCAKLDGAIVSVTGGEPFTHDDLGALCAALSRLNKIVKIETNGTLWRRIDVQAHIVVSPKPPKYAINAQIAKEASELKFVVDSALKADTLTRKTFRSMYDRGVTPTLQLESNKEESLSRALALQSELLNLGIDSRVLPQLHKLLNLP
jgi:organic radical activating enzyme